MLANWLKGKFNVQRNCTTATKLDTAGPEYCKIFKDFSIIDRGVSRVSAKAKLDGSSEEMKYMSSVSLGQREQNLTVCYPPKLYAESTAKPASVKETFVAKLPLDSMHS